MVAPPRAGVAARGVLRVCGVTVTTLPIQPHAATAHIPPEAAGPGSTTHWRGRVAARFSKGVPTVATAPRVSASAAAAAVIAVSTVVVALCSIATAAADANNGIAASAARSKKGGAIDATLASARTAYNRGIAPHD